MLADSLDFPKVFTSSFRAGFAAGGRWCSRFRLTSFGAIVVAIAFIAIACGAGVSSGCEAT